MSYTRRYSGTGLGLHLARQLLAAQGGTIHATSHQNKGSTFTFTLPVGRTLGGCWRRLACIVSKAWVVSSSGWIIPASIGLFMARMRSRPAAARPV